MTLLVIDAGNARVKWAVFERGSLGDVGSAEIRGNAAAAIEAVCASLRPRIETAVIGNVAGAGFGQRLGEALTEAGVQVSFARSQPEAAGVRNAYAQAHTLGVDRWAAIVAAFRRGVRSAPGRPVCVADAGTALTIDAVTAQGVHLGGLILPGFALQRSALFAATADISAQPVTVAPRPAGLGIFGVSTAAALAVSGPLALAAALERCRQTLAGELGDPWVVLTGGDAAALQPWLATRCEICPNLVLEGLAILSEQERSG